MHKEGKCESDVVTKYISDSLLAACLLGGSDAGGVVGQVRTVHEHLVCARRA